MSNVKYITKANEWFDEGTEAVLLVDLRNNGDMYQGSNAGIFRGLKDGILDEELCDFDEFNVVEG